MIKEQGAEDSEQTSSGPRVRALISSRDNLARITAEVAARRRKWSQRVAEQGARESLLK